jgi:hypothetical protein
MLYTMADLTAASGLSARTIRDYIHHKFIEPPQGNGPAALYTEQQLLSAVCIARMRARKVGWDEIGATVPHWSLAKLRGYVKKTDPAPAKTEPVVTPPPSPLDPPALEGEPIGPRARLPGAGGASPGPRAVTHDDHDAVLPDAPRWMLVQLLPGMALMVRDDAAKVVKRTAAEIIERYGSLG